MKDHAVATHWTLAAVSVLAVLAEAQERTGLTSGLAAESMAAPAFIDAPCGDSVMTQSIAPHAIDPWGLHCTWNFSSRDNGLGRSFLIDTEFAVCAVGFGVRWNTGGAWPVTVNLFEGDINGPYAELELRGSSVVTIPYGVSYDFFSAAFDPPVKFLPGENMVVELHAESRMAADGGDCHRLLFANNLHGETAPSYIRTNSCGIPDFVTYASLDEPNLSLVMTVFGNPGPDVKCTADVNGDGTVDVADLLLLLQAWGSNPGHPADINEDSVVDVSDLLLLLGGWGPCAGSHSTGACCFADGSCTPDLTEAECDGVSGSYGGSFSVCSSCLQPPTGEILADAIPIVVGQTIEQSTEGNPGGGNYSCGGQPPPGFTPTVWFEVQGTGTTMTLTVNTTALGPGSAVAVFCNHCDNQVCVTGGSANGSGENPLDAEVSWCAADGDTYHIGVWRTGAAGEVSVSLSEGGPCNPTVNCDADNSCLGHCGGQAPGGCWCDEVCCHYNDCCADYLAVFCCCCHDW